MWIFLWIPGALCVITGIVEGVQQAVRRYREENPYIGHLNYRDNRVGRYYNTRR